MLRLKTVESKNGSYLSFFERDVYIAKEGRLAKETPTTWSQKKKNEKKKLERQISLTDNNFSKYDSAFYLLTFAHASGVPTIAEAKKAFEKFQRDLRRKLNGTQYSAVMHTGTKHGRPHYHVIIKCKDREKIVALWPHGRVFKSEIYTDSLIYLVKYMYGGVKGKKNVSTFINSRTLNKPTSYSRMGVITYRDFDEIMRFAIKIGHDKIHDYRFGDNALTWKWLSAYVEKDLVETLQKYFPVLLSD